MSDGIYLYLDLNVFDRLEKAEQLEGSEKELYMSLLGLIEKTSVHVPYSNAHINDLFRGYQKNSKYIQGHLKSLQRLTGDLCICQYWNQPQVTWHFKDVFEFFNEKVEEWEFDAETLEQLYINVGLPTSILKVFETIPLDESWGLGYTYDPLFEIMFPRSRHVRNMYALMEDLYGFQTKLKSDYALYKRFKKHLIQSVNKLKNNKEYMQSIKENFKDLPKHLEMEDFLELYSPKDSQLENKEYAKILDVYYKHDLKGYKSDSNYNSMFDDSLHTFYAAHCDYFITNDDRCLYKAVMTYERLKIKTKVLKSSDFLKMMKA